MDGASTPQHRTATPPPAALSRTRSLGTRSLGTRSLRSRRSISDPLPALLPQRKRSVRFQGFSGSQLDGNHSETNATGSRPGSGESRTSGISAKLSERIAALEVKLNGTTGTSTIVHRANLRTRPSVPFIDTNVSTTPVKETEEDESSPSTTSSRRPSGQNADWSPISTASTAATSFTSPGSYVSR